MEDWHAHHVLPRSEGGTDDIENLAVLCLPCHTIAEDMRPTPSTLWNLKRLLRARLAEIAWQPMLSSASGSLPPATVSEPSSRDCPDNLDWRKWVYGGDANPFKNLSFIEHRVGCLRCAAS